MKRKKKNSLFVVLRDVTEHHMSWWWAVLWRKSVGLVSTAGLCACGILCYSATLRKAMYLRAVCLASSRNVFNSGKEENKAV